MKKVIAALAIFAMALATAPSAKAHAQVTSTFPKAGSVVHGWPARIWVEFDGNLIVLSGKSVNLFTVKDSTGKNLKVSGAVASGARLSAVVSKPRMSGKVQVTWRVVSEDGHPVSNSYSFTYIPTK